jgi:aspartyl-tRNA(Asn)/glutamyl-tRNA(Gln) amidotransferase subunit A
MYLKTREEGFGDEVKRRILVGTYVLSAGYYDAYYLKAQRIRRLIADDFIKAFTQCDLILAPSSPSTAFKIGDKTEDPVAMYMQDMFTISTNLAGLPAISAPAGFINKMPIGFQLIGNYFDEAKILNFTHQYQSISDWHKHLPGGVL